jgi:hypothetical protein
MMIEHEPPLGEAARLRVEEVLSLLAVEFPRRSNAELYDVLHERLCGPEPMERQPLLHFCQLVAEGLERLVELVALKQLEHEKPHDTAQLSDAGVATKPSLPVSGEQEGPGRLAEFAVNGFVPTCPLLAELRADEALRRLRAYKQLADTDPAACECLQLADFLGCTDLEIARLLAMDLDAVRRRRLRAMQECGLV